VNVERQDIGVTLRVTPQISEGDSLRLRIFQEITNVNLALTNVVSGTGGAQDTGVALTSRRVENTVVVADGETVVIGGLLSDNVQESITKVPFLGDIPILGWFFKTRTKSLTKINLLVFLTPHIVRSADDLEYETIRKRKEFRDHAGKSMDLAKAEVRAAEELGIEPSRFRGKNPIRGLMLDHAEQYPLERMLEIERREAEAASQREEETETGPQYVVRAGSFAEEGPASDLLTQLLDAGLEAAIVTREQDGELVFEIRVGPYETLRRADTIADVMRRSYGLQDAAVATVQRESSGE
jgi:hypothetical protein